MSIKWKIIYLRLIKPMWQQGPYCCHSERKACDCRLKNEPPQEAIMRKANWLQDISAATRVFQRVLPTGLVTACSGRRGRGRGSVSCERRLVALNLAILIIGESRSVAHLLLSIIVQWRRSTSTLEKGQSVQANVCMLDINTDRLGIKRCSSSLNQSALD